MGVSGRRGGAGGWWLNDDAAPPSRPAGPWDHSDRPAIATVRGDVFSPSTVPPGAGDGPESVMAAIRARDPGFDGDGFLRQVRDTFLLVEEAWTRRDPDVSRQVMADQLWQLHRSQIESYCSAGRHNVLDGLSVQSLTTVAVATDARYDRMTVRILASSSDYDADDAGKVVRGTRDLGRWSEDWSFQRAVSARTPAAGGTMSGRCPNCGAPLHLDVAGVCGHCQALIAGGAYDWVLAAITQVPLAG